MQVYLIEYSIESQKFFLQIIKYVLTVGIYSKESFNTSKMYKLIINLFLKYIENGF